MRFRLWGVYENSIVLYHECWSDMDLTHSSDRYLPSTASDSFIFEIVRATVTFT